MEFIYHLALNEYVVGVYVWLPDSMPESLNVAHPLFLV